MSLKLSVLIAADASSLKSEAASSTAAVGAIGASAATAAASIDKLDAAMGKTASTVAKHTAALREAANANREMLAIVERTTGVSGGMFGRDRAADVVAYGQQLDAIRAKFEPAFAAGQKYRALLGEIAEAERFGAISATSAIEARIRATNSYNSAVSSMAAASSRAKAAAEEMVADRTVTRDRAADIAAYGAELDELRAKYAPLYAAEREHLAVLEEIGRARRVGALDEAEAAAAVQTQTVAYRRQTEELERTAKATGLASHEIGNLRSQAIDVATMFSMGASPFQIISSQAGQIYEVLAGSKGGVTGALSSIGKWMLSLVTPTTAVIGVLAAASAAVMIFGDKSEANLKKAEKAADDYDKTLQRLKTSQGDIAGAAGRLFEQQTSASPAQLRRELELLARQQQEAQRALIDNMLSAPARGKSSFLPNPLDPLRDLYRMGTGAMSESSIMTMVGELSRGETTASELVERLTEIRLDPNLPSDLKGLVDGLLDSARAAAEAGARIDSARGAYEEMQRAASRNRMRAVGDELRDLAPDRETERHRIERLYREQLNIVSTIGGSPRSMQGEEIRINRERAAALDELTRKEEVARRGRELDLAGIRAVTVAERARLAAERERLELSEPGVDRDEVNRRADAAAAEVYAEAERSAADALRESKEARAQAGLVGYARDQAAIIAHYEREIELANGSAEAIRSLTEARSQDLAALEEQTRRDLFAGQESQLRALEAEAGVIAANDNARVKALATLQAEEELRRSGIELNSEWGRSYVENAEALATFETSIRRQASAFEEMRETAKDAFFTIVDAIGSGASALDAFTSAFAGIGRKMASAGFDKIFGSLFGAAGGAKGAPTLQTGGAGGVASVPAYSSGSLGETYSAPLGRVDRAPLPPLVTGAGFSSGQAAAAAGQSVPVRVWNFFAGKGLAAHQIAGIMGNAQAESAFRYSADTGDGGKAWGLFQWNDRRHEMVRNVGADWRSDLNGQLEFAWKELQTSESKAYRALLQAKDVTQATEAFLGFERPHGYNTGVRNSHNYSGRVRFAEDAYRQYGNGTQVASSTNDSKVVAKGVAEGMSDYTRREESRGADPWSGLRSQDSGSRGNAGAGAGIFSERAMRGFEVLGAGLGAFSQGYQSGSPISGGISGAFGGYQAGGAISSFLGVGAGAGAAIGVVGGAALGILGGILGARKQRQEAHKQAAARWAEVQPQYEAFKKSLSGEETGNLRSFMSERWNTLRGFIDVGSKAWKMGSGNSSAEWSDTFIKISEAWHREIDKFREGFAPAIESLSSGLGIDNAFSKGRDAASNLKAKVQQFVDDVKVAYGEAWMGTGDVVDPRYSAEYASIEERTRAEREANVKKAQEAAGEYALTMLYTAKTTTDVEQAIQGFKGTASGLQSVLVELGWTADQAAADIKDRLTQGIAELGRTFVEGFQQRINDLSGVGYENDIAEILKMRDTGLKDAGLLGKDPAIVLQWFKLAAQDVVNGVDLTGSAFDALIKKFPELAGVVVDATNAVTVTSAEVSRNYQSFLDGRLSELAAERADAESRLLSAYQRTVDWVKSLGDFRSAMDLSDASPLSGREKVDEARRVFLDLAARADAGDVEAQEKLLGSSQDLLDASRDYNQSSEAYFADFRLVKETLKATELKTTSQLDQMRSQVSFLQAINDNTKSLAAVMGEWVAAEKAEKELEKQIDGNRYFGLNPERNKLIDKAIKGVGLNYTGNYGIQPDGSDHFWKWRAALPPEQLRVVEGIIAQYIGINRQTGGLIPHLAGGGLIANGVWNVDSVSASIAGGGRAMLAGGEAIVTAPAVNAETLPFISYLNANRRLPPAYGAAPAGNDNAGVQAELRALRESNDALMRQLIHLTGTKADQSIQAIERGTRAAEVSGVEARRARALSGTRAAA